MINTGVQSKFTINWLMPAVYLFTTLASFGCLFPALSQASPINFFVDLDQTLVESGNSKFATNLSGLTKIKIGQNSEYVLVPYAKEFLLFLNSIPESRIFFFSAESRERNLALLEKIDLTPELNALGIAHKVLSSEDRKGVSNTSRSELLAMQPNHRNYFGTRKKDLRVAEPNLDLDRTILIDDDLGNVFRGQERNILHIAFHGSPSESAYLLHNRLVRAAGLIMETFNLAQAQNISIADANFKLQPPQVRLGIDIRESDRIPAYSEKIFQIGFKALEPFQHTPTCRERLAIGAK